MITTPHCRWGILGAAVIAQKNSLAITLAKNAQLVAVASRSLAKSQALIDQTMAYHAVEPRPEAMDSYEALLARPDIDAVYIPLPTGLRKEWALKAAAAGKHILIEKPVGCTARDVADMIQACDAAGVNFMDGVMFMHHPRLAALGRELKEEKAIGQLRRITSQFSFLGGDGFGDNIRINAALEPFGCLGDLGWYCLRLSLWAMEWARPQRVRARMIQATADGVPLEFSAELEFADHVTAGFYCSFVTENQEWAHFSGTQGTLALNDFVLPFHDQAARYTVRKTSFSTQGCVFEMHENARHQDMDTPPSSAPGAQEVAMFEHLSQCVIDKRKDTHSAHIALLTQEVMDACLAAARTSSDIAL